MAAATIKFEKTDKRPLKLFFQDEGRFGRINSLSKCWIPSGKRAVVGKQIVREFLYAFSSVCPETGENFSLIFPRADTDTMNIYLNMLSEEYKKYRIILLMDKAGWHTCKMLNGNENIAIMYLPAYSPELNPVEHIWKYIRTTKGFNNIVYKTLDNVEEKLCAILKEIYNDKETMRSLCYYKWMNYTI